MRCPVCKEFTDYFMVYTPQCVGCDPETLWKVDQAKRIVASEGGANEDTCE